MNTSTQPDPAREIRDIRDQAHARLSLLARFVRDNADTWDPLTGSGDNLAQWEQLTLATMIDDIASEMLRADNMEVEHQDAEYVKAHPERLAAGGAR